mmetsp:Transcript_12498/g.41174  ORF Transcript_12498/g.41174 Transcript_12498/m.41174 type:complete len:864 (-) Transcript_12498:126-2717(-)|eukprot:CAMPEP_0170135454 /NCGR_PEP_ID=MMETSP0033_2-20121228/2485_1 /TAXON_ID=195969 /ORGANISM="Dolichomastix tenuilepis, Strain CCMP3274" /LENGTH=863 /DNA_ID=CAMNT_0010371055 /DNA_START=131 /DNA_END=2722 /DNA_ORIENTATION=-
MAVVDTFSAESEWGAFVAEASACESVSTAPAFLPECTPDEQVPWCVWEAPSERGYVVYEDFKECEDSWLLLPGFTLLNQTFLAVVWFLFLAYLFLGVAHISDVFMSSIEVITSKETTIKKVDPKTGEKVEVKVEFWNATVANLTLMALGSSAPEILLAVGETVTSLGTCDEQDPGELGASTIVGSASYNLLVITAVCMVSVPAGEKRCISELPVFLTTAFFSVVAYIWMYVVYIVWTPDIVSLEEAIITAVMFPLLVILAYAADQRVCLGPKRERGLTKQDVADGRHPSFTLKKVSVIGENGSEQVADRKEIAKMLKEGGSESSVSAKMAKMNQYVAKVKQRWSVGRFRINALRMMTGGRHKVIKGGADDEGAKRKGVHPEPAEIANQDAAVSFLSSSYSVMENAGVVRIIVVRSGPTDTEVQVDFYTEDGTAEAGDDYKETKGTLVFAPGIQTQEIQVGIIDDNQWEPDENFQVHLTSPSAGTKLGATKTTTVTIIDDDDPGILGFVNMHPSVGCLSSKIKLEVIRRRGADGRISVNYETIDGTAVGGKDFEATKGSIVFEHGETSKEFEIPFLTAGALDVGKEFQCKLVNPVGGAQLSKHCEATCHIVDDALLNDMAEEVALRLKRKEDAVSVESSSWAQQFRNAIIVEGSVDDDGNEVEPDTFTLILHYLTITWKVMFAVVPPTDYYGGWATFVVSLIFIGGVTMIVEQVAVLLGCTIGIPDSITAITLVALGTSLPDTFASVQATRESDDADAAIGNVTGSNSVNVFLGLGLPWLIATLHYQVGQGCDYQVAAGTLSFSVALFSICAVLCICIILARRALGLGELGGETKSKYATAAFLVSLWCIYLGFSIANAKGVFM